jgi:Flp pilus assembly protein TadD
MKTSHTILISVSLTAFFGLNAKSEEITFDSEVHYKKEMQSAFSDLKKGDVLQLKTGETALVSTAQGMPLLVYSAQNKNSQVHVDDENLNSLLQEQLQPALEKATGEIISGIRRTEGLLQKRDYVQALAVISPIKEKYPAISSVLFLSATVHYLSNNKGPAMEELQKGLQLDPNNEPAKKLLDKLKDAK